MRAIRCANGWIGIVADTPELPGAGIDPGPGFLRAPLFLQRILQAADGILDLALDLIAFALGGKFGVTDGLAGHFLDSALGLFGRADDTIFVHLTVSPLVNVFAAESDGRAHGLRVFTGTTATGIRSLGTLRHCQAPI